MLTCHTKWLASQKLYQIMMTNVMQSPGNQGFMVIPRSMLREIFRELGDGCPLTDTAAYLYMLYTACYTEQPQLHRGEMQTSVRRLSLLLGWGRMLTFRYLNTLKREGIIRCTNTGGGIRITLLHYNKLCRMECGPKPGVNRSDEKFEEFWQAYHELTQMPAVDKEMARRAWSKLNAYERGEARKNIEWYICEVGDMRRLRSAAGYLARRSFVIN